MATNSMSVFIQQLRRTMLVQDRTDRTDGQLLEDYISRRDEAALAALVRRHGPMVWDVCRRVLCNYHDAEDAFQATFLVLVRKATSILPREMVANWLYGVAHQTALKARVTAATRKRRERQVAKLPEPAIMEQDIWHDLQPLLDHELSRLPDKYRVLIVLCDLEGKTRKEAARQLGIAEGTVAGRLARARTILAKRLTQRGVTLSGGALAALLTEKASATVPTSVVSSTIKAASLFAVGQAAATGLISVKVAALTEGVLKTMLLTKLRVVLVVLLLAALSSATGLIYLTQAAGQSKAEHGNKQPKAEEKARVKQTDEDDKFLFPDTPPPFQALAVVQDKYLILTRQAGFFPGGKGLVKPIRGIMESLCELKYVQAFDTKGKPITAKRLRALLKKQTDVLVSADDRPVDPFYLRLIKEGTVVLILQPAKEELRAPPPVGKAEVKITCAYNVLDLIDQDEGEPLVRLITRTILPKSWYANGGDCEIEYQSATLPATRTLVIRHRPETQEQVKDLLDALRRVRKREFQKLLAPPKLPAVKP